MRGGVRWFALVAGMLGAAYFAMPDSPARGALWTVLTVAPAVAVVVGVRRYRPDRPLPWLLLAAGQVAFAAGDALPYGYLVRYPFLAVGLLVVVRRRTPRGDRTALLDALILSAGCGLLSWVFLIEPARGFGVAYPVGDLVLLAVVARLWSDRGARGPAFALLLGGLAALLVSDTAYAAARLHGGWSRGCAGEIGWFVFYVALGAAALHPSMRELDRVVPATPTKITRLRFAALLAIAALLVPAATLVQTARGGRVDLPLMIGSGLVLFALVLVRMSGLVGALREVHRAQSENRFHRLTRHASDVITVCDVDGVVHYVTPSVERVFGWRPEELKGRPLAELMPPDDAARLRTVFAAASGSAGAASPGPLRGRIRTPDGDWVAAETVATWLDDGDMRGYLLTTRDVTERQRLEEQLTHQAFHDSLTGLANRALFLERVRHGLDRRSQVYLAVLVLDLDDFKTVNDSLGPAAGDELLRAVADRLRGCLRTADTAARLGGDEFALLVEDITDPAEAAKVATRALAALQEPVLVEGRQVVPHASIGIAVADPDSVTDAEDLLRNADVAMYTAKQQGKDRYDFFAASMHAGLVQRLDLTAELRAAVHERELQVYYQPIVSLPRGGVVGVEALVRWPHQHRGLVEPTEFIPLAEDTGLVIPLGAEVLAEACAQVARWRRDLPGLDLTVSVNLSPRQVQDPSVVGLVRDTLATTGLPPHALTLEITESALPGSVPGSMAASASASEAVAVQRLVALKNLGVRLAVDDFGTGYSSLSRLHQLPIDILKIPKPFVDGVTAGPTASALARAILELSAALGLAVVAEGIEHADQARVLYELGCRLGQGYHFGRPVPAAELARILPAVAAQSAVAALSG
jgi:diguanylate cyclase (GGDEF)-like protein/PAS domain S-box-containing protein